MSRKRMLIVDDNDSLCQALRTVFEDDYDLSFAASGEEALDRARTARPQVVLMDYKMPGMNGIQTLERLRAGDARSKVVMMSAYSEIPTVVSAVREGAENFVSKPFDVEELKAVVARAARSAGDEPKPARRRAVPAASGPVMSQSEVDDLIHQTLRFACA